MAHQRYSAQQWQRLIEKQANSDQSQIAFCAAHDLSKTTFQHWKRRLRNKASAPSEPLAAAAPFTPLLSTDDSTMADTESDHGWDIELDLGDGLCLRLRRSSR